MNIQTMNLSRLLNNQHLTFHREFEALIVEKTAATLDVVNAFAAYQQAIEAEDAAMMKIMKSKLTSDKTNADNDRIKKMTGSFDVIRLAAKHFNTEKNEPGKRLSVLLSTYLKIEQGDYDDRTGRIRNYIQDVRSEKYSADADAIGLTEWIDVLEEANERCADLADEFNTELRDKNSYGKVSDLRLETDKAYRSLVERINALALVNGEEEYADLITRWNTRIDAYRNAISRRLGAGKGGNTGGSENQPTEPTEPTEPEEPTDPDPEGERPGGL